eukprot:1086110-Prymnesium_polylepis.1
MVASRNGREGLELNAFRDRGCVLTHQPVLRLRRAGDVSRCGRIDYRLMVDRSPLSHVKAPHPIRIPRLPCRHIATQHGTSRRDTAILEHSTL